MVVTVAVVAVVVVIQFHVTGDGTRAPIFLYKFQFHGRCGGGGFFERLVRVLMLVCCCCCRGREWCVGKLLDGSSFREFVLDILTLKVAS